MTRRIRFLSLLMLTVAAGQMMEAEPLRLWILSYNVHHCEGVDAKVLDCYVPDEQIASDHRTIFAEIELAP